MPIQTSYEPISYAGDGIANAFAVTWPYQFNTDLVVTTVVAATGTTTVLVLGTDYSVFPFSNSPAAPGTVTTTVAVPVGTDITITRAVPITQDTTWVANDPNPTLATENAVDKLTMIAQDMEAQIAALGSGATGIVTTATFVIAAIASTQTVTVNDIGTLVVGNNVQISTGAITIVGQIIADAGLNLTVTTLAIVSGGVGTVMPIGAAVQLASVPNSTTITVQDLSTPSTPVSGLYFDASSGGIGAPNIAIFVQSITGGVAQLAGNVGPDSIPYNALVAHSPPGILGIIAPNAPSSLIQPSIGGQVPIYTGGVIGWGLLGAANITAGSLTPPLFTANNSPSVGQALTYVDSGHFIWANVGGSGVPGGGNAGQFLNGAVSFTNTLTSAASGGTPFQLTNTFSTTQSLVVTIGPATSGSTYSNNTSGGTGDPLAPHVFKNPIVGVVAPSHYPNYASSDVESFATNAYIRAAGMRVDRSGYWQRIATFNAPASTVTLDLFNAVYNRFTGFANNVTFVVTDSTATTTSGDVYATDMYVEIVAPGAFTITWPANITWANGASAPTLSTTGISIVRLRRRQGQTQWIGYLDSSGSNVPGPGTITASSQFGGTGFIPVSLLNTSGSPSSSTFLRGDNTWAVPASGINVQQNGGNVGGSGGTGPFTTINCTTNLTATNIGGVLTLSAAGGGGGTFSPSTSYVWTAGQTFQAANSHTQPVSLITNMGATYNNSTVTSTIGGGINTAFGIPSGVTVSINNLGTGGADGHLLAASFYNRIVNPNVGISSINNVLDIVGNYNIAGFYLAHTNFTNVRQMNGGGTSDSIWFVSNSPSSQYSGSPDPGGITHSYTSGVIRIGEVNYANLWADFGLEESRVAGGLSRAVNGMDFFPNSSTWGPVGGVGVPIAFDVQYAVGIGYGGSDGSVTPRNPRQHLGLLVDQNAISPGGYAVRLWGSVGTFTGQNGTQSATTNAPAAIIKMSGTTQTGIDFAGTANDSTVLTCTNTGNPVITMADGQSIKLGSVWIRGSSSNLQFSSNGTSWTTITIP